MSLFKKGKKSNKGQRWSDSEREPEYYEMDDYDGEYEEEYYEEEFYEEEPYGADYHDEAGMTEEWAEEDAYYEAAPEEVEVEKTEYAEEGELQYPGEVDDDLQYTEETEDNLQYMEETDDDLQYVDEDEDAFYEEEDEERFRHHYKKKGGGISGVVYAFKKIPLVDKIIAVTGVAVLVFAIITATVYNSFRNANEAVEAFANVGVSLEGIGIIGESGLLAVADAQLAREAAMGLESEEMQVEEEMKGATVVMKTTSIVKDLKIKFVNQETDKLVPNVPFEVEVKTPSGKTENWKDDDKDGVIYKEEIAAGKYEVKMLPLSGEEYADYKIDTSYVEKADVKATIEYKKVDVADEIKTEAQVNAALEDTANAELAEESKLEDTVPFLASKVEKGAVSYKKIDKSTIKNPETATASINASKFYLMDVTDNEGGGEGNTDGDNKEPEGGGGEEKPVISLRIKLGSVTVGGTLTIGASVDKGTLSYTSSDEGIATVSSSGVITGVAAGTATITISADGAESKIYTVTVTEAQASLTLNPTAVSVAVNGTASVKATLSNGKEITDLTAKSADTGIAEVSYSKDTVTVKGKKTGSTKISVEAGGAAPVECTVTVTAENTITFNPTEVSLTLPNKKTAEVKVTTVPENAKITGVSSKDTKIATVSYKDKTVTVTAAAKGSTEITVTCDNNVSKSFKVTVTNTNDNTPLVDVSGNQVYVLENGNYRKAVYADYYKFNEFYIQTYENLYTGWTELNGKMYYYLANHKYVTGEQVIQGAKYTFASDGSLVASSGTFGIDVSKWNGSINWNSVKAAGVNYAIIRCGYRGSTTGALITDPKFKENISGATAAGIKVGIYFFTQAVNEKEAVEEASMVLSLISKYRISYPVFLDVESSGGRADGIDKGTRSAVCRAFCATIQNSGYMAGVYANKTWLTSKIDAGSLGSYKIWLAQYAAAPSYTGRYNLWQYSSKGSIPGISGNVDLNQSYLGY